MPQKPFLRRIRLLLMRGALVLLAVSLLSVLVLRFLAPPVSALMIDRRLSSCFAPPNSPPPDRWVSLDKTAPAMGTAVIAAEDQNFPQHYGFDWLAVRRGHGPHRRQGPDPRG